MNKVLTNFKELQFLNHLQLFKIKHFTYHSIFINILWRLFQNGLYHLKVIFKNEDFNHKLQHYY